MARSRRFTAQTSSSRLGHVALPASTLVAMTAMEDVEVVVRTTLGRDDPALVSRMLSLMTPEAVAVAARTEGQGPRGRESALIAVVSHTNHPTEEFYVGGVSVSLGTRRADDFLGGRTQKCWIKSSFECTIKNCTAGRKIDLKHLH